MTEEFGAGLLERPRAIVLVDGEHYPPVIEDALKVVGERYTVVAAVFLGGTEKLAEGVPEELAGVPVVHRANPGEALRAALGAFEPAVVVDLSDEPVLDYRERLRLANLTLFHEARYEGADFRFDPPPLARMCRKPSIALIGMGKRVGKTAVSAYAARVLKDGGFLPAIVAMGRGGPPAPEVLHGAEMSLDAARLLQLAREGRHAASDYFEDALMSKVTTIGCRRCGGGLGGAPFVSNVVSGAEVANGLREDIILFEGSGSTLPPVRADRTVTVVAANQPLDHVAGYFGPFRLMLCDLAVVSNCEEPSASPAKREAIISAIRSVRGELRVVEVVFRPRPLEPVAGEAVFFATTAPPDVAVQLAGYLESRYGCSVVATTSRLSERGGLRADMEAARGRYGVVVTELKAAAVDVVTSLGLDAGARVVYCDNEPVTVGGDGDLADELLRVARGAREDFLARQTPSGTRSSSGADR